MEDEPGVVVSLTSMYELLQSIDRKVSELVTSNEAIDERIADHEARLRIMEARRVPAFVIGAVIGFIPVVVTVVLFAIDHNL